MRLAPAFFVAAAFACPVFAQDAAAPTAPAETAPAEPAPAAPAEPLPPPDVATISPTADRDFWCALAFSLTSRAAQISGDATAAGAEAEKSQVMFAAIVTAMKAANLQEQQFNALVGQYTVKVMDPFSQAEGSYTREVCEAAVPEARAIVDAAQAAAPADPATPDAPAADAPAADAPAADAPAADAPGTEAPAASQ
jgi:hypothetical protein